jgi:hypothetical protein
MKKQAGLWIDHRKAVIVIITDEGEEIHRITSNMRKHTRFKGRSASQDGSSEDVRDRQLGNQLNSFYDAVVAIIRGADTVHIFGPGEAKGELAKRLEHDGVKERILVIETVDKMTDHQISTKVRGYVTH